MILHILLAAAAAGGPAEPAQAEGPTCAKPVLVESPTITATVMTAQMEQAQDYVDCMSKAIEAQRKVADETLQLARGAAEKTNAMIVEVNDFVAKVKTYQEEHSGN